MQGSQAWQSYRDGVLDNTSQRLLAGIGTDRISLFKGEIYAGYQRKEYDLAAFEHQDAAVFGGQLFWYPTRDLTFGLNVDRSLGESTLRTAGNTAGSPIESTSVTITGDYILDEVGCCPPSSLQQCRLSGWYARGRYVLRARHGELLYLAQPRRHL